MFHHRLIRIWLTELRGKRWLHTLNPDFLRKKKKISLEENEVTRLKWVLLTKVVLLKLTRSG